MTTSIEALRALHLHRLTDGAEHYTREEGAFEVRFRCRVESFPTLVQAFLFYMRLKEPATLWDVTEGATLIERKVPLIHS